MPSCLLLESIIQDPVYGGDNHHKDPMILFSFTSSRIDSIRASQYLVDYKVLFLIIHVEGHVTDQHPPNKVLQLANILRSRTFLALDNIKADSLTFGQGFETFSLDRRMMHKKIFATFLLDKAKPL